MSILQEAYKYTTTRRGSELTEFVISAPVLLMGSQLRNRRNRCSAKWCGATTPTRAVDERSAGVSGAAMAGFSGGAIAEQVATLYGQAVEFCWRQWQPTVPIPARGAWLTTMRVVDGLEAVAGIAGLARDEIPLTPALIQEMNEHISQTDAMRQPWVWVVEVILHEIAAGDYPYPIA